MFTPTTQALASVQAELSALRLRYAHTMPGHHEGPRTASIDGEHRAVAMRLRLAEFEEWRLQQFLPTEAPNDPPQHLPGAA